MQQVEITSENKDVAPHIPFQESQAADIQLVPKPLKQSSC